VIAADAYLSAMDQGGVRAKLRELVASLDSDDSHALARASQAAREHVHAEGISARVRAAVLAAYRELGPSARVAVRSSATQEDSAGASFAGMNETFVNIEGEPPCSTPSCVTG
jgi:pyruvate,water dikinase